MTTTPTPAVPEEFTLDEKKSYLEAAKTIVRFFNGRLQDFPELSSQLSEELGLDPSTEIQASDLGFIIGRSDVYLALQSAEISIEQSRHKLSQASYIDR